MYCTCQMSVLVEELWMPDEHAGARAAPRLTRDVDMVRGCGGNLCGLQKLDKSFYESLREQWERHSFGLVSLVQTIGEVIQLRPSLIEGTVTGLGSDFDNVRC